MVREDRHDLVYKTRREKYNAIVEETRRLHDLGFPVLIGTTSVDASETLSRMFSARGLHAQRAQRQVPPARGRDRRGRRTARRGHDRDEHGRPRHRHQTRRRRDGSEAVEGQGSGRQGHRRHGVGGLHIIGSERHESRRIDRQLRGRSGRQGDPGASQFFLSLEDDLMRLFGSERIATLMDRLGAQEGEVLTHPLITRSIEQAQKRVELQNFQARKRLLDYDDVMNQQREVIYSLRAFALEGGEELKGEAMKMIEKAIDAPRRDDARGVRRARRSGTSICCGRTCSCTTCCRFPSSRTRDRRPTDEAVGAQHGASRRRRRRSGRSSRVSTRCATRWGRRTATALLSLVMLNVLDEKWKDHLYDLDQLRNAIHYRSWGQKDPLIEYKQEAYTMFVDLMNDIYNTFAERFLKVQLVFEPPAAAAAAAQCEGRPSVTTRSASSRTFRPTAGGSAQRDRCGRRHRPVREPPQKPVRREQGSDDCRRGTTAVDQQRRWSAGERRLVHGRPQRSVPMRLGKEVQEVSRSDAVARSA